MELHDALKNILSTQNKSMLASLQIINFLNDYRCFADKPAIKLILRDIIRSGYAEEILTLSQNDASWRTKFKHYVHDFIDSCGYKEELATYVFESIAFALNLDVYKEEPKIRQKVNVDSFFDLNDEDNSIGSPSAPSPQPKPQVDPQDTFAIAQTFFNEKKYQQAKAFIERAILNYTNGQAPSHFFLLKGDVLRCLELHNEAIAAYNECLSVKAKELNWTSDALRDAIKKHEVKGYENFIFHYFLCLYNYQRVSNAKWIAILKKEARAGSSEAIIYCAKHEIDPIDEHINIYFVDMKQLKNGDYLYDDGTFAHEYSESKRAICFVVLTETSDYEKSMGWTHGYFVSLFNVKSDHNYRRMNRGGFYSHGDDFKWSLKNNDLPFPHSHFTVDDISHWDDASKIKTELLISFNDYNQYPVFKAVRDFQIKMPINSASPWFLPSVITLREIFLKVWNPRIDWHFAEIWTSSQADSNNAIIFRENGSSFWTRIESKQMLHPVVPICAF